MFRPSIVLIRTLALAAWSGGTAAAGLMNLDTATPGEFRTTSFEQDGIRLSVMAGHYDLWRCNVIVSCPAAKDIVAGLDGVQTGASTVRISLSNGAPFNLESIAILSADSSALLQASNGSSWAPGLPSGSLAGFQGITYFDISSSAGIAGAFLFDNIAVFEVPEPGTGWLLSLSGLYLALLGRVRPKDR